MSYSTTLWADKPIASFFVMVDYQEQNVKRNLFLAAQKLNGQILVPGQVFSFNQIVGEGSVRNGFLPGRIYFRDSVVLEPGGGLCVVSSSLYNLFLVSGLQIIERHRHSKPVSYVPLGLDATIRYGLKDLKVKNPYTMPLTLRINLSQDRLSMQLWAEKALPVRYEMYTEEEEDPYPLQIPGKEILSGISVSVYRRKWLGKTLRESKLLYTDYFPPMYKE